MGGKLGGEGWEMRCVRCGRGLVTWEDGRIGRWRAWCGKIIYGMVGR
jgi:hypothetical protein